MNLDLLDQIHEKHILVVGDVMLDKYTIGSVQRQSPEAPVPILAGMNTYERLGGAANVAFNIKALGAKATILGVIGKDYAGSDISRICSNEKLGTALIVDENRRTTVKHRFIADSKHLLRVDDEDLDDLSEMILSELRQKFSSLLRSVSGVVLSDYNKGTLTTGLISELITICKKVNVPVYVDPKFKNFDLYRGVDIFKPNVKELRTALNDWESPVSDLVASIHKRLDCRAVICTMASEGMAYHTKERSALVGTEKLDIVDVSGAGDTVMAVVCLADQCKISIADICKLSNIAGKLACLQSGVVAVTLDELKKEVRSPSADKKNN